MTVRLGHEEGLDAAPIAVPPFAHPKHEEAAAERGLDIPIEKPVGLTSEQVEATGEVIESADIPMRRATSVATRR